MSQQSGSFSLVIHDKHGNPQYLKVHKSQPKKPETVKVFQQKPATSPQVITTQGGNSIVQGSPMLRTVSIQGKQSRQYVTVPLSGHMQSIVKQEPKVQTVPVKQLMSPQIIIPNQNTSKQYVLPLETNGTRKRIDESEYSELNSQLGQTIKRRKSEKGGKGLRHFSMKVCEKVKKKGLTSYNEVADELVSEFTDPLHTPNSVDQQYDQKNIRRRVYDALNVLMAMNIISKEKKEIKWLGLPTNSAQECVTLQNEKKEITDRIRAKTQQLNELILQQILYKSIIQRNYEMEKVRGPPVPNSAIQLPFIVVNSSKKTVIDCSITNDKSEYLFAFNDKFEIHDDFEVLKKMGLSYGLDNGAISKANLNKVKTLVPTPFEKYIDRMLLDADDPANDPGNSSFSWSNNIFAGTDPLDESAGPSSDGYNHLEGSPVDPLNTDDDSNISEEMDKN